MLSPESGPLSEAYFLTELRTELKPFSSTPCPSIKQLRNLDSQIESALSHKLKAKKESLFSSSQTSLRLQENSQTLTAQKQTLDSTILEKISSEKVNLSKTEELSTAQLLALQNHSKAIVQAEVKAAEAAVALRTETQNLLDLKAKFRMLLSITRARISPDGQNVLLMDPPGPGEPLNLSTPQQLNASTPQQLNSSTPQHLNGWFRLVWNARRKLVGTDLD